MNESSSVGGDSASAMEADDGQLELTTSSARTSRTRGVTAVYAVALVHNAHTQIVSAVETDHPVHSGGGFDEMLSPQSFVSRPRANQHQSGQQSAQSGEHQHKVGESLAFRAAAATPAGDSALRALQASGQFASIAPDGSFHQIYATPVLNESQIRHWTHVEHAGASHKAAIGVTAARPPDASSAIETTKAPRGNSHVPHGLGYAHQAGKSRHNGQFRLESESQLASPSAFDTSSTSSTNVAGTATAISIDTFKRSSAQAGLESTSTEPEFVQSPRIATGFTPAPPATTRVRGRSFSAGESTATVASRAVANHREKAAMAAMNRSSEASLQQNVESHFSAPAPFPQSAKGNESIQNCDDAPMVGFQASETGFHGGTAGSVSELPAMHQNHTMALTMHQSVMRSKAKRSISVLTGVSEEGIGVESAEVFNQLSPIPSVGRAEEPLSLQSQSPGGPKYVVRMSHQVVASSGASSNASRRFFAGEAGARLDTTLGPYEQFSGVQQSSHLSRTSEPAPASSSTPPQAATASQAHQATTHELRITTRELHSTISPTPLHPHHRFPDDTDNGNAWSGSTGSDETLPSPTLAATGLSAWRTDRVESGRNASSHIDSTHIESPSAHDLTSSEAFHPSTASRPFIVPPLRLAAELLDPSPSSSAREGSRRRRDRPSTTTALPPPPPSSHSPATMATSLLRVRPATKVSPTGNTVSGNDSARPEAGMAAIDETTGRRRRRFRGMDRTVWALPSWSAELQSRGEQAGSPASDAGFSVLSDARTDGAASLDSGSLRTVGPVHQPRRVTLAAPLTVEGKPTSIISEAAPRNRIATMASRSPTIASRSPTNRHHVDKDTGISKRTFSAPTIPAIPAHPTPTPQELNELTTHCTPTRPIAIPSSPPTRPALHTKVPAILPSSSFSSSSAQALPPPPPSRAATKGRAAPVRRATHAPPPPPPSYPPPRRVSLSPSQILALPPFNANRVELPPFNANRVELPHINAGVAGSSVALGAGASHNSVLGSPAASSSIVSRRSRGESERLMWDAWPSDNSFPDDPTWHGSVSPHAVSTQAGAIQSQTDSMAPPSHLQPETAIARSSGMTLCRPDESHTTVGHPSVLMPEHPSRSSTVCLSGYGDTSSIAASPQSSAGRAGHLMALSVHPQAASSTVDRVSVESGAYVGGSGLVFMGHTMPRGGSVMQSHGGSVTGGMSRGGVRGRGGSLPGRVGHFYVESGPAETNTGSSGRVLLIGQSRTHSSPTLNQPSQDQEPADVIEASDLTTDNM